MLARFYQAAFAIAITGIAGAAQADEDCQCREISIAYTSGHIDGYPQGPANTVLVNGYTPIPDYSFNSLGFDGFHQWNFKSHYDYGRNRFYLDYDRTRLENDYNFPVPTAEDFEGTSSPYPGSFIAVSIPQNFSGRLDYYRLGYQRLFEFEWLGRSLTLAPGVEMNVLDVEKRIEVERHLIPPEYVAVIPDYDIIGGGAYIDPADPSYTIDQPPYSQVVTADPGYTKWGLRIGGEADYQLSERLSLTAELYDTAPIDDWPDVFTAMLGVRYRVYGGESASVDLFARGGAETIKLDRGETPWNDLRAEYRDLIQGGISVRF